MPNVDVKNLSGETVDSLELPPAWFTGEVNVAVMHEVVTAQLAARRQGSHQTKNVAAVRGGGAKPWRQKGTGRARHGSIRNPQWVGGGHAHHREPRDYRKRVNRKVKRAALRSALTDRANEEAVTVVRGLEFDHPRTRDARETLEALGHAADKVLVVLGDRHLPTWRSFRNLSTVHLLTVDQLNTYDVLDSDVVVFDEDALPLIGTGQRTGNAAEVSSGPTRAADPPADDGEDEEVEP